MTDILAFGAHPDDIEIAMGGTLTKFKDEGCSVGLVHLTNGEPTPKGTPEMREAESQKSYQALGADFKITLDMPNRYLFDSVENRTKVAEVIREHRPKIMFAHYWDDQHPDHIAAFKIAHHARFHAKLTKTDMKFEPYFPPKIYYFMAVHLRFAFKPSFIVGLSEDQFNRKVAALTCYQSQFDWIPGSRAYERITSGNHYFGALIGQPYGEPFITKEEIAITSVKQLF